MKSWIDRFWNKVIIGDFNSCWNWIGARKPSGYGNFFHDKKFYLAHRVSYELYNGCIDNSLIVLHMCDNPKCVNPRHLYQGSQMENIHDMINKGRHKFVIGSKVGSSKLTETQVEEILLSDGTDKDISKKYPVNPNAISEIKRGDKWSHVRPDIKRRHGD